MSLALTVSQTTMDNLKESQQITKTKKTRGRKNSPILEPIPEKSAKEIAEAETVDTGFEGQSPRAVSAKS